MRIGKIIGTIVATKKDEKLVGNKLMITQPLTYKLKFICERLCYHKFVAY